MAEEKKEKWTNYLALTTVLIAVCATLATFKGGGYSTKSLMNQSKASDQWAFFQSKSLKSYIFESQRDNLELQKSLLSNNPGNTSALEKMDTEIDKYGKKISKYDKEKQEIKKIAEDLEKESNTCKLHSGAFGIAVIFLQIAILLSSISALMKKKYIWIISLAVGLVGIIYFFDGFFLFI
jgi:hypothetical protein